MTRAVGVAIARGVGRATGVARGVGVTAGVGVGAGVSSGTGVACGVDRDDGRLKLSSPGMVCGGGALVVCARTASGDTPAKSPATSKAIAPDCARRGLFMEFDLT
ncbi:hypothetical protein NF699_06255 [Sphingomonadaceae bacterium OTU29LAMAA1]|nr:hypothetical protein NF699_06255 [Sphingomonadaceae bacterium OTU29LAMAA1]